MKKAIFLFDYTGIMAKPWLDAGYECWCFDGQHSRGISRNGNQEVDEVEKTILEKGLTAPRDRNLLLAEVRDCTISGPRNPAVVCFTSLLSSLTVISSPHPFCFLSTTHNLP